MIPGRAEVKTTALSEAFDYQAFVRQHWKLAVPLFAVDPKGRLRAFGLSEDLEPGPDWRVVALVMPAPEGAAEASADRLSEEAPALPG